MGVQKKADDGQGPGRLEPREPAQTLPYRPAAEGRDTPVSARVSATGSPASWEMRSVERLDGFDYGGATLVESVGDRVGILVPRAYSLPVFLPALHQRLGFGRYGRRHR
jgi:hypothetical protein